MDGHGRSRGQRVLRLRDLTERLAGRRGPGRFERFGHPEIIVRGASPPLAHDLLNQIGELVSDGHQFTSGGTIDLDGAVTGHVGLISVDPAHVEAGRFDAWFSYYARAGHAPPFSALQVLLSDGEHCWHHQDSVGRLAVPPSLLDGYSGNRATRRARQRWGRRG